MDIFWHAACCIMEQHLYDDDDNSDNPSPLNRWAISIRHMVLQPQDNVIAGWE